MLETIAALLVILWVLGLVSSYTLGGFIHLLLVIAVIMVILRIIQGRRVL
ncbi:lmo0937 family membrane protein [Methylomonas paludis]|uniref:Lmo0937 family membrane protein n=1 Tax=Methylomonas paludis TaxID=1173101 RepID=A0A975MNL3_9GAMM|nr:lmo0937 family membrane protein [Methylomonas paludis]QWF71080.1 lmo0937 family membrane protein [Methylomonas paludis]